MQWCLLLVGGETESHPRVSTPDIHDPRQTFDAALHPQLVELNPGQLGTVIAAHGDYTFYLRGADGRIIGVGVGKGQNGTIRHIKSPPFDL